MIYHYSCLATPKKRALNRIWEQFIGPLHDSHIWKYINWAFKYMNTPNTFEWVLNTPWMLVSACEYLWVSTEHVRNSCECTWTPLSQYWTCLEHLWARMNANEWVGMSHKHLLSVHQCLWVSIWKIWMHTSRAVNLTNL
jgi:hypothetical protein